MMETVALKVILEKAWSGLPLTRSNIKYLLSLPENSLESRFVRQTASTLTRLWTENTGVLLGEIGIDCGPCAGGCKFCTFGFSGSNIQPVYLSREEVRRRTAAFCAGGDLYAIVLQTMHHYRMERLLDMIQCVRETADGQTRIWVNVGDTDRSGLRALKAAGVEGIYHACRLREGVDTALQPKERLRTMKEAVEEGLKLFTCCEPIGPEHTLDELADSILLGIEYGAYIHAAMPRVCVPGSPLFGRGQISEERLAHITACIALAFASAGHPFVCAHEPSLLGLQSGASVVMAESGANPRDIQTETAQGRGFSVERCRRLLAEAGFTGVRRGDKSKVPLLPADRLSV